MQGESLKWCTSGLGVFLKSEATPPGQKHYTGIGGRNVRVNNWLIAVQRRGQTFRAEQVATRINLARVSVRGQRTTALERSCDFSLTRKHKSYDLTEAHQKQPPPEKPALLEASVVLRQYRYDWGQCKRTDSVMGLAEGKLESSLTAACACRLKVHWISSFRGM